MRGRIRLRRFSMQYLPSLATVVTSFVDKPMAGWPKSEDVRYNESGLGGRDFNRNHCLLPFPNFVITKGVDHHEL